MRSPWVKADEIFVAKFFDHINVNAKSDNGWTALFDAVYYGMFEVVK
jgi:ankyrin repeat protein